MVKNLPASAGDPGDRSSTPGSGRSPGERRKWQPTPVFLPGKIPWTEEPGRLQSVGLQRVGHDRVTKHTPHTHTHTHTHTRTHTGLYIIQALWKARGLGTVKSCLLTRL